MMSHGKREKLRNQGKFFKVYIMRIKKERPGIISEKINPESDMSLWRS